MHQYLFFIGDFPVRAYGLILSLSIILATGVAYFLAKQDGRYHSHIVDMGIYCGIAGLLGARLWDVFFFDWDYYQNHLTELLNVWQGGMAIQGGVLLGAVVGILYTRRHGIDNTCLRLTAGYAMHDGRHCLGISADTGLKTAEIKFRSFLPVKFHIFTKETARNIRRRQIGKTYNHIGVS